MLIRCNLKSAAFLTIIVAQDLQPSTNVQMYLIIQVVTRYCMIYFSNCSKIGFDFLQQIVNTKSDFENLIFYFDFMVYYNTF